MTTSPRVTSQGWIVFQKDLWSVVFYISFNKVIFWSLLEISTLISQPFIFMSVLTSEICLNLILKRDLPIIAFHKRLVSKPHGVQTQLRVECALRISKLMTSLHFSQFLWNVIFPKFLGQALPYQGMETVSGIQKKKTTLKQITFTEKI